MKKYSGTKLKKILEEKGISQAILGDRLKLIQSTTVNHKIEQVYLGVRLYDN